jgi:hypothetical protein
MRLFQNSSLYPSYLRHLNMLAAHATTFEERRRMFLNDRYGALHLLQPVLANEPYAFFTNGDDQILQNYWASEKGMPVGSSLEQILLAQVEHHQTENASRDKRKCFPTQRKASQCRKNPSHRRKKLLGRPIRSSGAR